VLGPRGADARASPGNWSPLRVADVRHPSSRAGPAGDLNGFLGSPRQRHAARHPVVAPDRPSSSSHRTSCSGDGAGTALGVLAGDLAYTWLAVRLMRRTGRDVTAMPFGSTRRRCSRWVRRARPVMVATGDPVLAWKVGMARRSPSASRSSGLLSADWARRVVPRPHCSIDRRHLDSPDRVLPMLKILRDPLIRPGRAGSPAARARRSLRIRSGSRGVRRGARGHVDLLDARRSPGRAGNRLEPARSIAPWPRSTASRRSRTLPISRSRSVRASSRSSADRQTRECRGRG